jgi:hypothetical protein
VPGFSAATAWSPRPAVIGALPKGACVTHHNEKKHHEHQHEREEEKKREKLRENKEMRQGSSIHPGWFVGLGVALIAGVLFVWIFVW